GFGPGFGPCGRGGTTLGVGAEPGLGPGLMSPGLGTAGLRLSCCGVCVAGCSFVSGFGAAGLAAVSVLAAAGFAGADAALSDFFSSAFLPPPNASRNRRATGASTVDDADFTNSPCSFSLASTSLLVTPSSFASSCTRALPATALLICRGRRRYPLTSSLLSRVHGFSFTADSCRVDLLPVTSAWHGSAVPLLMSRAGGEFVAEGLLQLPGVQLPRNP